MKISVIIPVKNRASLLPITLDNVLAQSLKPFEVIVVDDGSSDDIASVKNIYKQHVTFVDSNGSGPGAARNTGFKVATGDFIQFFDSDDLMTNNKLQIQAQLMQEKKADIVYGPYVKASFDLIWQQQDVIMQYHPLPPGKFSNFVLEGWCNITQSVLFRRELLNVVGVWREDLLTHEDYEYWFRVSKVAKVLIHENKSCTIYRQHINQITDAATSSKSRWLNGVKAMNHIEDHLDFKPPLSSYLKFKGRLSSSKSGLMKHFGKDLQNTLTLFDYLALLFFKITNKIGRSRTGTAWQRMNGVLTPGTQEFDQYTKELKRQ